MKAVSISTVAVLVASTMVAHAETFSVTGTDEVSTKVTARDGTGQSITTTISSISQQLTIAGGRRATVTGQCTSRPAQSREKGFASAGACELGDATGTFSVAFSCKASEAGSAELQCVGEITGVSGAYGAKTGKMSWRAVANADGSVRTSAGTGEWN